MKNMYERLRDREILAVTDTDTLERLTIESTDLLENGNIGLNIKHIDHPEMQDESDDDLAGMHFSRDELDCWQGYEERPTIVVLTWRTELMPASASAVYHEDCYDPKTCRLSNPEVRKIFVKNLFNRSRRCDGCGLPFNEIYDRLMAKETIHFRNEESGLLFDLEPAIDPSFGWNMVAGYRIRIQSGPQKGQLARGYHNGKQMDRSSMREMIPNLTEYRTDDLSSVSEERNQEAS